MSLTSRLFAGDQRLEACLVDDRAHVTIGDVGLHVAKIQFAILEIDGGLVAGDELDAQRYGVTTAKCVLDYKVKRGVINRSYQGVRN